MGEAGDWRWSSARSHLAGQRVADDPLTDVAALGAHVGNWRAMLRVGLEAIEKGDARYRYVIAMQSLRDAEPELIDD